MCSSACTRQWVEGPTCKLLSVFLPAHTAAGLNSLAWPLSPACHACWSKINPAVQPQVLDQDYDWVFGSDVTYCDEMLLPLAKLMRQLVLTGEQSSVVKLAHMHRNKDLDKAMREAFHGTCSRQAGRQGPSSTGCAVFFYGPAHAMGFGSGFWGRLMLQRLRGRHTKQWEQVVLPGTTTAP